MLAGAQQRIVALWLVAVLTCAALLWRMVAMGQSPVLPLVGLVLLLCGHAGFLLLEFSLAWWQNRSDPAPRASVALLLHAWLREAVIAPRVFGWQQPFRARVWVDSLSDTHLAGKRRGVVLIHGFVGNRGLWNPWLAQLHAQGVAFCAVNLEPVLGSIDDYAGLIDAAVCRVQAATGLSPVLVCHSMGGLATRAWLRTFDADHRVHCVVTLGTPHHGTWLSRFGQSKNGRQMRQESRWLIELAQQESAARRALFVCYYSNGDNIVFPCSTAAWEGAGNRFIPGIAHVALAFDARIRQEVIDLTRA